MPAASAREGRRDRVVARRGERGAVLVQVAVMLTVLIGVSVIAVDYGVLWVARAQAQTAADAAALAGATSFAFDSVIDTTGAENAASAAAGQNHVWHEAAAPIDFEPSNCTVSLGRGSTTSPLQVFNAYTCLKLTVRRDTANGNALPTFFGKMIGVGEQGVAATAKAASAPANSTPCLFPLALADKWRERTPDTTWRDGNNLAPASTFTKYNDATGYPNPAPTADTYTAPSSTVLGNGFQIAVRTLNYNAKLTLTPADITLPSPGTPKKISSGQFVTVQVPRLDGGDYVSNLASCGGVPVHIGDALPIESGASLASITTAATSRVQADPGASWNNATLRMTNSCAFGAPPCAPLSPRLVALPVFDLNVYEDSRWVGTPAITIVNIVGFFIESVNAGTSIVGHLAAYPGDIDPAKPQLMYLSSFLRAAVLVR